MRIPVLHLLALGTCLAVLPACASSGSSSSRSGSGPITAEHIAELPSADAYNVIERLRPGWLRTRGRSSIQHPTAHHPVVYLDSVRYGGIESLRQISSDAIRDIRFINASDATTRYGTGHAGGVILVRSRS